VNEQQDIRSTSSDLTPTATPPVNESDGGQRDFVAPLAAVTAGRLEIAPGASRFTIVADPALPDLLRAHFEGQPPQVRAEDGTVTVRYPRHSFVDLIRDALKRNDRAATITLNGAIPWQIEVDGGVSEFEADLRALRLEALRVGGGASQLVLRLPRAAGVVPVRLGGGASQVRIHRPAGVAARLRVRGGASKLTFDEQYAGAIGGEIRWQSPDFAAATDRYEIEIGGGASDLTIDSR
jgi:hypothetical protein